MTLPADVAGDGPPVLLVHGFPDSRRVWRHQIGPIAAAGHRVLAPDLTGFGEAERPPEVELAVVMGAHGEIAGYAVADDVSARDLQKREPRWVRAKGFDTSCPWGPWITTADDVPDPEALRLSCHVNGEVRQDSTTADLVFGPRALVDFIAETCTLEPGDLILTGTPQGVGQAMDPPRFLSPGDVVRCEIEGLGTIEHRIEAA